MKKLLLLSCAVLFTAGAIAQTKPASKAPAKPASTATAKAPVPPAPPAPPANTDEAPALDENGWPVTSPTGAPEAPAAPAKAGAKAPAAKPKAPAKAAAPAKPVVYQPAAFVFSLDAKPLDIEKGLPAKAKGTLSVGVKNFQKVERENPKAPIKMQLTHVPRTGAAAASKEVVLAVAKKGIPLESYFGTPLKPGDQIRIDLTNVKTPQTAVVAVEVPESSIFSFTHEGKKLDKKKGLATGSTGVFAVTAKGLEKLKKADTEEPVGAAVSHMRNGETLNKIEASLQELETGLLLEGIAPDAKAGDQIRIELLNTDDAHLVHIPVM